MSMDVALIYCMYKVLKLFVSLRSIKKYQNEKKNWGESSDSANKFFVGGFEKKKKVIFIYIFNSCYEYIMS